MSSNDVTTNKTINIIAKIFTWVIVAITVFMMIFTIFSVLTFDRNDRQIFGIKFYIVMSDSMSKSELNQNEKVHFNAGDIILAKTVKDPTSLKEGDIISFISQNEESFGNTVTHKIHSVVYDDQTGRVIGYKTYGTNTGKVDDAVVEPGYILGTYAGKLPKVGYFFNFLKQPVGYIICILVPFLLLIVYNLVNVIRLFRKYKAEQTAIMDAERQAIAEERKKTEAMLLEIQALKAQMEQKNKEDPPPSND